MTPIFINELHYDNASADVGEFIEVAGPAGTALTGWSIVLYNGNGGAAYGTLALGGSIDDEGDGFGTISVLAPGLQNGSPDGIALVDASNVVIQFLSYEGSFTAVGGVADGLVSVDIGVAQAGSEPIGSSLHLVGVGAEYEDFTWGATPSGTPGSINGGQTFQGGGGATPGVTIAASGGTTLVVEGGAQDTITVVLSARPTADVTITLTGDAEVETSADGVAFAPAAALTFTPANWDVSQTVTIRAVDDTDTEANPHPGSIAVTVASADAGYDGITVPAVAVSIEENDLVITRISEIQGTGSVAALLGQTVTVRAVVVGDFQNGDADTSRNLGGFYLQEELVDQDGNALTSEGLFVFQGSGAANALGDLKVGDIVEVTGSVSEFRNQTQISATAAGSVRIVTAASDAAEGQAIAEALRVDLDLPTASFEAFEGMLVNLVDDLTVTELFNLDRFGEFGATAGGRPEQFTNEQLPDVAANTAYLAEVAARRLIVDDGIDAQNPNPIPSLFPRGGSDDPIRMGDVVTELGGVLRESFGYRIADPDRITIEASPVPREEAPPEVGGTVVVAAFNVLNFFNGDGLGGGFDSPEQRGADTPEEFARQVDKTVTAILGLGAEVIALNEIENDGFGELSAIADLVDALNGRIGRDLWAFVEPAEPTPETDAITVGMLYRSDRVGIAPGTTAQWHDGDNPFQVGPAGDGVNTGRAPIAVTFEELRTGETFTTTANHFKSKGGSGTGDDVDMRDGQGAFNGQRVREAISLAEFLEEDPTGTADPDRLILGDLNSYLREDPVRALEARGYDLLTDDVSGGDPYSFVFDGFRGALDHALSSASLTSQVSGIGEWHINADEADALDYNLELDGNLENGNERSADLFDGFDPFRASDHDPLLVGLDLGIDELVRIVGTSRSDRLLGRNQDERIEGGAGNDVIEGRRGGDALFGGDGDDVLAADRVGRYRDLGGSDNSELFGEAGDDLLIGGGKADFLSGGAGDDRLFGHDGNDILEGNAGDDLLDGGLGDDILEGGAGFDTASYATLRFQGLAPNAAGLDVDLSASTARHAGGGHPLRWTDTLLGIESVVGTDRNDRFVGDAFDNVFDGGGELLGRNHRTCFRAADGDQYRVAGDVYEVEGVRADYAIERIAGGVTIEGDDIGTDTLVDIEFVKFADALVRTSDLLIA